MKVVKSTRELVVGREYSRNGIEILVYQNKATLPGYYRFTFEDDLEHSSPNILLHKTEVIGLFYY